jgi:hypothetical protein
MLLEAKYGTENSGFLGCDIGLVVSDVSKERSTLNFEGQGVQEDFCGWLVG